MEENKKENLNALKKFLEADMRIKEKLLSLAPNEFDDYDEEHRIKYVDKLYKALGELESEFLQGIEGIIIKKYGENWEDFEVQLETELCDSIAKYFAKAKSQLEIGSYEQGICQKIYREQISNMKMNFVEKVKETCVAYAWEDKRIGEVNNLVKETQTVNELLHLIHSYITNNEYVLSSLPLIDQKENTVYERISLYGENNEIAKKIFDEFPLDLDCGTTDIISLKDKIIMMVRDRGHALNINIDTSTDNISVKYFVPKTYTWIDNSYMQELPGINKKSVTENGAMGSFDSSKEEISEELFGFIEKVPTDDIVMKKYRESQNDEKDEENIEEEKD